jgi:CRISPR-associated protein Cmr2
LWFGSWLLSELSKAAARAIGEEALIFPRVVNMRDLEPDSGFNVANKILAEIDAAPDVMGLIVKAAIDLRFAQIRDGAFQKLASNKYFEFDLAVHQTDDLVEFFWAAVESSGNYVKDRARVEKLLSARKATRNFGKVTWGNKVPKSSLDGQRESCIHEDAYGQPTPKRQEEFDTAGRPKLTKDELRDQFGVKEAERLCGVGLLKRLGNREGEDSFFSTSHVASLPLLSRLEDKDEVAEFVEGIRQIKGIERHEFYRNFGAVPKKLEHAVFKRYDGHLLFAERLNDFFSEKEKLANAKQELRRFLDPVIGKDKEPLPYYALLLADGDFIGKAIDAQDNIGDHQALSAQLADFAANAVRIIESERQGSLIYAGGDDVLALVGVHKVLEYASRLEQEFRKRLKDFTYDGEKSPTLSVGIAVVHHLEPLEDALELVRRAERAAKSVDGKNAIAVIVDKRSGTSRIVRGAWGTLDERLRTYIDWLRADAIPDGAAYQLRDLALRLEIPQEATEALEKTLRNAKEKEAIRILKRKKRDLGENTLNDETIKRLERFISDIEVTRMPDEDSIEILADEMIVARIFADAEDLAGVTNT